MRKSLLCVLGFFLLLSHTAYSVTNPPSSATITLDRSVYFLMADGSSVAIAPGTYTIEAADEWLRLIPGERHDALLVEAEKSTHDQDITEPTAVGVSGGEDEFLVTLLLPGGQSLEAMGTYSGIRSRAVPRSRSRFQGQTRRQNTLRNSARAKAIAKPTITSVVATRSGYQIRGRGFGKNRALIKVIEGRVTLSQRAIQSAQSSYINVGSKPRSIVNITVLLGRQKSNTFRYDPRRGKAQVNPAIPGITKKQLPTQKKMVPYKGRVLKPRKKQTRKNTPMFSCAPNAASDLSMSLTSPPSNGSLALGTQLTWVRTGHDVCAEGSQKEYVLGLCQQTTGNCNPSNGLYTVVAVNAQNWSPTDPGQYTLTQNDIDTLEGQGIGSGDAVKWEMRYRHASNSNFGGRVSRTLSFGGGFTSPPSTAPVFQGPGEFTTYTFANAGTLTKSWQAVQNAAHYEYYVLYKARTVRNPEFGEMLRQDGPFTTSNTTVNHTAVVAQHTNMVVWRVRACNPLGCGPWGYHGNEVTNTPPQTQPVTFQDLAAVFQHANCVNCHRASSESLNNSQHTSALPARNPNACTGCHQDSLFSNRGPLTPQGGSTVPMHPVPWQAPPSTMKFDVTGTALCNKVKEQMSNTVTTNDLKHHLLGDPLILWAVQGGQFNAQGNSRNGVPGWTLQQWADKVKRWQDNNYACQ